MHEKDISDANHEIQVESDPSMQNILPEQRKPSVRDFFLNTCMYTALYCHAILITQPSAFE